MLASAALILLLGLLLGSLFSKMKLPGLLGMTIVGIILSPHAINFIDQSILIPFTMGLACGQTVLTVAVLSILITAPFGAI